MKLKAASHLTKNLHWAFISNDMWFGFHLIIQKDKMIPQSLSWSLYVQLIWFSEVSELHRKGKKKKKWHFQCFRDETVWKFHFTIIVTEMITVINITVLLKCAENVQKSTDTLTESFMPKIDKQQIKLASLCTFCLLKH